MEYLPGIIFFAACMFIAIYVVSSSLPNMNALAMAGFITGLFTILAFKSRPRE